jgi:hemerythrin superfamily protein
MNLYEMLHQDHEKARALFAQLEAIGEEDDARREQIYIGLYRELDLHSQAEEKFFYSQLKGEDETRDIVLEALDDHKEIRKLMDELEAMDKSSPDWSSRLATLQEKVEHHVQDEERELFPRARRALTDEEAAGIADDIEAFKEEHEQLEAYE